jgi:hypothetical protein
MEWLLDPKAPSIAAEYGRYLDGDFLGKILFKNTAENIFGIPVFGDGNQIPSGSQRHEGRPHHLPGDALIRVHGRPAHVEIKFSHLLIDKHPDYRRGDTWQFAYCRYTSKARRAKLHYDILFAIGLLAPPAGEDEYWGIDSFRRLAGRNNVPICDSDIDLEALPHESRFLSRCGVFCMPFKEIEANTMRPAVRRITKYKYNEYFAWGHDTNGIKRIWDRAVNAIPRQKMQK